MKISVLKIAYFSDLIFPSNKVATKQILKTVENLYRDKTKIELFISAPLKTSKKNEIQNYYTIDKSLPINEIPFFLPPIPKFYRVPFTFFGLKKIQKQNFDLLYVRHYFHLRVGLSKKMKVLFETYKSSFSPKIMKPLISLLNKDKNFIGMITHSEMARQNWIQEGANPKKIISIHNGIDENEITQKISIQIARQTLKIDLNLKIISYIGNMGIHKDIESILEIARFLPDFTFYLIGFSEKKDENRLKKYAENLRITNLVFIPWMTAAEFSVYIFASNALMIPPSSKPLLQAGKTVLPLKTFMYLASGVPILAPNLKDISELLQHKENSFLLTPDSPEQNAREISKLFSNPKLMETISENAFKKSKSLTWENRAKKIIQFIEERF